MSDEQKRLLECSEKDIGKYHADVPKGHGWNHKQWAKEGQTRVEALLRLWGCNNGVSNNSLLVQQQGVSEEGNKGVEQYVNYSNYGGLIFNRNDGY